MRAMDGQQHIDRSIGVKERTLSTGQGHGSTGPIASVVLSTTTLAEERTSDGEVGIHLHLALNSDSGGIGRGGDSQSYRQAGLLRSSDWGLQLHLQQDSNDPKEDEEKEKEQGGEEGEEKEEVGDVAVEKNGQKMRYPLLHQQQRKNDGRNTLSASAPHASASTSASTTPTPTSTSTSTSTLSSLHSTTPSRLPSLPSSSSSSSSSSLSASHPPSTSALSTPEHLDTAPAPLQLPSLSRTPVLRSPSFSHSHSHSHSHSFSHSHSHSPSHSLSHSPSHIRPHSFPRSHTPLQRSQLLTTTTRTLPKAPAYVPRTALTSAPEKPSVVFCQAVLVGIRLATPVPLSTRTPELVHAHLYCSCIPFHLDLFLEDIGDISFHTALAAYSLPLLWVFAPGLGLLLTIFQALSLLAAFSTFLSADSEQSYKMMDPPSSASSFTPSSSQQPQLRHNQNRGHHHRMAMSDNIVRPNIGGAQDVGQPSGSHHHFIHHAQDNITSNGSSSNSNRSGGPLAHSTPSSSPLLPQVSNIARQTQVDIQASHQGHDHVFNYAFDPMSHGYDDEEGIDDGEDRHSDEGSEDEAGYNEMEYYLQRCSICFDARLDFCLEYCRDQFCRDCFQRYVKEVVSNSWGLNVTKIKCPVCQDIISMSEWTKYVDKATLAQYNQYNQPYRSFSRFCNQCDHEMVVSQVNCALLTMPPRELMPLFDGILADLKLLLTLGGIELDDITPASSLSSPAKATSGHASTTKSKQRPIISERDQKARNIIQSFADAYRSYCGDSRGIQSSLPFKAQSYVSSLAYRALGGPVVQADPLELANQPNAASQQSQQPVSSSSMSTLHLPPTSSTPQPSQVLRPSQIPQTSQATQTHRPQAAPEQLDRAPGAFFLRRQHPLKAHGVLEMYKALMLSLLDLFDLKEKQSADEPRTSFCIDTKTMEAGDDRTSRVVINIGNATEDHRFRAGNDGQESNDGSHKPGTEQQDTVVHTSNIKRKGLARVDSPQAKRSRSTRPGVITRAESKRQVEIKKAIVHLSKQLSSMETRQEQWKELQFLHVRWLRWDRCTNCDHELCLQCGESSHHNSEDCFEHMRSLITETNGVSDPQRRRSLSANELRASNKSAPFATLARKNTPRPELDLSTIQWKLANTNPCPNCCILIHRDDGCNKVDCMLCGYRFCWICREPWGAACGFFKCGRRAVVAVDSNLGRSISNMNEGSTDALMTTQGQIAEDGQVRSPSTAHGFSDDVVQSQVEVQHVLESMPAATSEKPEIGVPNVFVIHTKRSRA